MGKTDGFHLVALPDPKAYPHLTRWEQLEDALIGAVRYDPLGAPVAVCYDLQKALNIFSTQVLGSTGSYVVDAMETVDNFKGLLLNSFMGPDTPFFWSSSDDWGKEVQHFCNNVGSYAAPSP